MQRDKNHPNYAKIKELSDKAEKYFDTRPNTVPFSKKKKIMAAPFILMLCLLPMLILNLESNRGFILLLGVVALVPMIAIMRSGLKEQKKTNQEIIMNYNKNKAEADKAREECKKLVNQI